MDGTLIDSTESDYIAWKKVFSEYNVNFSHEEYVRILGVKSSEVIKSRLNLEPKELESMLKRKITYFKEIVDEEGITVIPHVESFLKEIKRVPLKMALATGSRKEKLTLVFEKLKLKEYFDVLVTGDEVSKGKPGPEIFLKATERLNILPTECIVVEDAENGVMAAKNANMHCIAITTTTSRKNLQAADLIIDSFENLNIHEMLKEMEKSC